MKSRFGLRGTPGFLAFLAAATFGAAQAASITPGAVGDTAVTAAIGGRPNLALASAGSVAFSSSDLGPNYTSADVNDGVTDHTGFSWIQATATTGDFVGVALAAPTTLDSVVWHGQEGYNGRSGGDWTLEYTTDANPGPGSAWTAIGTYTYAETGCASPMPRSLFSVPNVANVTGVRLLIARIGCGIELAIQELEVYGAITSPPNITTQPAGGSFSEGSDIVLSVVAERATTFQWKKDGVDIPQATTSTYTISNAAAANAGSYSVVVGNAAGSVPSAAAVIAITPAPVFATYAEAVQGDKPIHYYPMDETTGTVAADVGSQASGGGIYTGGFTLDQAAASPRLGKAVRFDGAPGTFVDLGLFHPGAAITVEAWANLDTDARAEWNAIVARWDGSYEIDFAPGSIANFVVRDEANTFGLVAGATASQRGQWHHLAGVFSGGVLTIYVDGVKGTEITLAGGLQDAGPDPNRVLIGATRSGTASSFNFKGLIDEVAIYDTGLTAVQIRNHYRTALPSTGPELAIQKAVLLTWPSFPPGYIVQSAPSPDGPWTNYTEDTPVAAGDSFKLTVPAGDEPQYFRLVKP